jgi:hypothetical protein
VIIRLTIDNLFGICSFPLEVQASGTNTKKVPFVISVTECDNLFDKLSSQLHDKEWDERTALPQTVVEDMIAQYRTWGYGFGADERLPCDPAYLAAIITNGFHENLAGLIDALEKLTAIASGERPNIIVTASLLEPVGDEPAKDSPLEANAKNGVCQVTETVRLIRIMEARLSGLSNFSLGAVPKAGLIKAIKQQMREMW